MDDKSILADHKERMDALAAKHGSMFAVPPAELAIEHERTRGMFVKLKADRDGLPVGKTLADHGVMTSIVQELGGDMPTLGKKVKRSDKHKAILDWCAENVGEVVSPNTIAEIGGVSYATANELIKSRVDLFGKVKRGQYVVRNPELERALEKQ